MDRGSRTPEAVAITDRAYGVILVRRSERGLEILMVKNWRKEWGLPKGHSEGGETGLEAAERETREETGMSNWRIISDLVVPCDYCYVGKDGGRVRKSVTFYVAWMDSSGNGDDSKYDQGDDEGEILEKQWCTLDRALSMATFETTREVLVGMVCVLAS